VGISSRGNPPTFFNGKNAGFGSFTRGGFVTICKNYWQVQPFFFSKLKLFLVESRNI